MKRLFWLCVALILPGCGGNGGAPAFPVQGAYDTAVIQKSNNTCITTYSVHRDGSALRSVMSCGSGTLNKTVSAAVVSKLFNDLQTAQPLNALPSGLNSDFALQISWNGQTTPNLEAVLTTPNASEQALLADADAVIAAFPR